MPTQPPGTGTPAGRNVQLGAGLAPAAGGKNTVAGSPAPNVQGTPGSPCLISWPSAGLPLVGSVGGGCLLSKTNVRAMVGGLLIGAGGLIFLGGIVVLVAAGFRKTGALDKVAAGVGFVPGVGPVAAAGLRTAAHPAQARQRQIRAGAREDAARERALGQPRENANLREGRGAVRETGSGTRRRRAEREQEPPF